MAIAFAAALGIAAATGAAGRQRTGSVHANPAHAVAFAMENRAAIRARGAAILTGAGNDRTSLVTTLRMSRRGTAAADGRALIGARATHDYAGIILAF